MFTQYNKNQIFANEKIKHPKVAKHRKKTMIKVLRRAE